MRILLKAMGFWVWGLIAIALAVSFVSLSYRLASVYRWHTLPVASAPSGTTDFESDDGQPALLPTSRVIAKEMRAARSALYSGRWIEALRRLEAAQAVTALTAVDVKTIEDFKAFAYVKINNFKAAQTAYEAELATGIPTAEETVKIFRTLFRLAATNKDYSKAVEYGQRMADASVAGADDLGTMSQLYFLQKDCRNSAIWADKAVAALHEAGEPPRENLYQFKLQCASDIGDTAAMTAALMDLIRLTNKPNYWNTLLRIERQAERDDHNLLMIYRLMYDTHSMAAGTDYIEMAQLLGDQGLAGEALSVLEKAMASGLILDMQKERTGRLLNAFQTRADADRKKLPIDPDSSALLSGMKEGLGEVYYGFGDYPTAVDALDTAIEKHWVRRLDDAYIYVGRSEVAMQDTAAARAAFALLKSVPNVSPGVLRLWSLYADTIG